MGNGEAARKIVKNFSFLTIGKVCGDLFTFLFFVVMSRAFGQEGLGQYSVAMGITALFAAAADFGLYNMSIKELSRRTGRIGEQYSGILTARLVLSAVVFAVLLLVANLLHFSSEIKLIILIIGTYQVLYSFLGGFITIFVAREEMHFAGILEFTLRAVITVTGIMIIALGGSLVIVLIVFPVATAGQIAIAYGIVTKKYGRPKVVTSWSSLTRTLREAIPFAASELLFPFYARADVICLGILVGTAAAGVYNAAYRVVFLLLTLASFATLALFPVASRLYVMSRNEIKLFYQQSLNLTILICLPGAIGIWWVAPQLIHLLYGEAFAQSVTLLRILAVLLLLGGLRSVLGVFLISCNRQADRLKGEGAAACANILGNLLLIPILGMKGAAITTVAGEALMLTWFVVKLSGVTGWPRVGSRLLMSIVASVALSFPGEKTSLYWRL